MLQKIIIIVVVIILFFILVLFSLAVLRRITNARKYREMDGIRSYYLKILEQALENRDIIPAINSLLSTPGSIKFHAIEDILFKLQERYPEDIKELFIRLGYVSFYESMLLKKNRIKRSTAIDKLGRIGVDSAVNRISSMLNTQDKEIISVSIRALANIGSLEALAAILDNLQEIFSRWLVTRKSIETALIKFGEKGSFLLIRYGRNISDSKVLAIILDALSHLNNVGAAELALDNLYHTDPEVRSKALKILEKFSNILNGSALEKVLTLARDPVWFVRVHVAKILGTINGKRDIMNFLERLVLDENRYVRNAAAASLAKKGEAGLDVILRVLNGRDRYAMEILCEEIEKTDLYSILIHNLTVPESDIRIKSREILNIMNRLGFSTPLKEYLKSAGGPVREELKGLFEERTV
ncbi:MAG: HEAT repeat domain-containing protein [Thermodesulfovibrionales bacterium]|nr:HEAT repeat domain-containing protein [Thermodesulfovibrionales bacterium]